jgi:hypothetical protein
VSEDDIRDLLMTLDPKARDDIRLRRVLIRDQADRNAIASRLMRYRDQNGQDWADIIDLCVSPVSRDSPERSPPVIITGYLVGRGMWRKGGPSGRKPRHC